MTSTPKPTQPSNPTPDPARIEHLRQLLLGHYFLADGWVWFGAIAQRKGVAEYAREALPKDDEAAKRSYEKGVSSSAANHKRPEISDAAVKALERALKNLLTRPSATMRTAQEILGNLAIVKLERRVADPRDPGLTDLTLRLGSNEFTLEGLDGKALCNWVRICEIAAAQGVFLPREDGATKAWSQLLTEHQEYVVTCIVAAEETPPGTIREGVRRVLSETPVDRDPKNVIYGALVRDRDHRGCPGAYRIGIGALYDKVREVLTGEPAVTRASVSAAARQLGAHRTGFPIKGLNKPFECWQFPASLVPEPLTDPSDESSRGDAADSNGSH